MPGDVVAVLGIGGLGHLGVQFANKLGFCTVAIARGSDKKALSRKLGAHHFIDSATEDVAAMQEYTRIRSCFNTPPIRHPERQVWGMKSGFRR
jgi:D-arabinose 1-dehydrogenase-like Zn-dependent alcohol dehydrogenase